MGSAANKHHTFYSISLNEESLNIQTLAKSDMSLSLIANDMNANNLVAKCASGVFTYRFVSFHVSHFFVGENIIPNL